MVHDVGRRVGLAHLGEDPLQLRLVVADDLLGLLDRDVATTDEGLGVELAHRALLLDQVVHQRLGVRRVVALVVTATAVADQVDDDVAVERLPVLERQPGHPDARLGVVAVDVEDRRLDHPRDVGAVQRGPRRAGRGREADLVVDDQVHGAAGAVAAQLREVERLGDDSLAGERRVAVQQQRKDREGLALVEDVLLRAGDALQDGVDGLEVARVRGERHLDVLAGAGREVALGAEVVLHVAGALDRARVDVALELAEDLVVGLADDVGQHVEPAAVGHADGDLVEPGLRCGLADLVDDGHGGLAALEGEPLLADELGLEERLERLGLVELLQDPQLLLAGLLGVRTLDPLLDPAALLGIHDVHVLDAGRAAVGVAQDAEDVAQLHEAPAGAAELAGGELAVEVPERQAVRLDAQVGVAALLVLQRVGVGHQVAAHPVGVDQLEDPGLLVDLVVVRRRDVGVPADRLVGDPERAEDVVVEAVLAQQQLVDVLEELARTGRPG